MTEVYCPNCHQSVPLGSFCSNCAQPLSPTPRGGLKLWWKQQPTLSRVGVVLLSLIGIGMVVSLFQAGIRSASEAPRAPSGTNEKASPSPKVSPEPKAKPEPTMTPVVDIPKLMGKSAAELERALGGSVGRTKITADREFMPGDYRDYKIGQITPLVTRYDLVIRFYKGRAVHFTLDLPRTVDTPAEALLLAGINVRGQAPRVTAPGATRWTGTFNDVAFKDAAAVKAGTAEQNFHYSSGRRN